MCKKEVFVSYIEPVGGHGGMNYYNSSLCNGLSNIGCNATLFTCDKTKIDDNDAFRVVKSFKNIYGKDSALIRGLRYLKGSAFSIFSSRLNGTSLFHFHFFQIGLVDLFNIFLTRLVLGKVVITVHDIESFSRVLTQKYFTFIVYRLAHTLIVHNQYSKNELLKHMPSLVGKVKIIVHGNYLEYAGVLPDRDVAREKLKLPKDADVLLFFGQIKEVKGLEILIEAVAIARKTNPKLHLLIAGKVWKDDFDKYEKLINQHNLSEHCTLHIKYIPDDEVSTYYSAADLNVLPYKKIYQSGVLLMAMSFGKVVLTSDLAGMTEVVIDNKTGFLFQSENVIDLSNKIVNILKNKQTILDVEENAMQLMKDEYDWNYISSQTLNIYCSLV